MDLFYIVVYCLRFSSFSKLDLQIAFYVKCPPRAGSESLETEAQVQQHQIYVINIANTYLPFPRRILGQKSCPKVE